MIRPDAAIDAMLDRKQRVKAIAELEADATTVNAAALAFIDGARRFAAATGKIANVIPDARGMHVIATNLAGELPEATALIGYLIRQHAKAIRDGVASPRLSVPEVAPLPAPAPDRLGFRIGEVVRMTNTSRPTVNRWIASGAVKTVMVGTVRLIPRGEIVRLGLLKD